MKLEGKAAFITGGGSGIGAETARVFTREGAAVTVVDLNAEATEALTMELTATNASIRGVVLDVTDEAAVTSALAESVEAFGSLDIVVNSAIRMAPGKLIDLSTADWKLLFEVGLHATFVVGREAAKLMIDQGTGGSIINLSSNAGLAPYPAQARIPLPRPV